MELARQSLKASSIELSTKHDGGVPAFVLIFTTANPAGITSTEIEAAEPPWDPMDLMQLLVKVAAKCLKHKMVDTAQALRTAAGIVHTALPDDTLSIDSP